MPTILPTVDDQVTLPTKTIPRGTTILARTQAFANGGGALSITSAYFAFYNGPEEVFRVTATVVGGNVTCPQIDGIETAKWPDSVTQVLHMVRAGGIDRRYIKKEYRLTP